MNTNISSIRKQFPILCENTNVSGKPLVYFDNAATSQKPRKVIEGIQKYYSLQNANIHRGLYKLSSEATALYEDSRKKIQKFINAKSENEIIFTKGTTESINLLAYSYATQNIQENDEILITEMEHHSNIVPWQIISQQTKAKLRYIPLQKDGTLNLHKLETLLSGKTKLVAITHVSNALGTINPLQTIIEKAHAVQAKVLVDGAQAIQHLMVDVQKLDCDFYCFSGHKMYGPTGIGVLYGKEQILENMPPFHGGGEMIKTVSLEKSTYAGLPAKFEAGTPNICGAISMQYAVDFIQQVGYPTIQQHEKDLFDYAYQQLSEVPNLSIIGDNPNRMGLHSFVVEGTHPHDIATLLDQDNIAIRAGHHCAQPIIDFYKIPATCRISFAIYSTKEEIDCFIESLTKVISILA